MRVPFVLDAARLDRVRGVVLGTAVGDALGAGYEFGSAPLGAEGPQMIGGGLGGFAPGEWTDDTTMAWAVLDVAATGADLRDEAALDAVTARFVAWAASGPPDIGIQTRAVLGAVPTGAPTAAAAVASARAVHERTGRSGGNGSLMRTAPVALAHLDDPGAAALAARRVSRLTHHDPQAGDACVLWTLAIRHAVLTGEQDVRIGLDALAADARTFWAARLEEAEQGPPARFRPNGWVVTALQAAWSAIHASTSPTEALATAIGIGDDTDTVAAIAGGLLGAVHGAEALPAGWRALVHGHPGLTGDDLADLAVRAVAG